MSEIKHTAAPWHVGSPDKFIVRGPNGYPVCDVTFSDDFPGISEANANLIAAAPELIEALEQLVRPYGVADVGMAHAPALLQMEFIAAVRKAKDAIAKATASQSPTPQEVRTVESQTKSFDFRDDDEDIQMLMDRDMGD